MVNIANIRNPDGQVFKREYVEITLLQTVASSGLVVCFNLAADGIAFTHAISAVTHIGQMYGISQSAGAAADTIRLMVRGQAAISCEGKDTNNDNAAIAALSGIGIQVSTSSSTGRAAKAGDKILGITGVAQAVSSAASAEDLECLFDGINGLGTKHS